MASRRIGAENSSRGLRGGATITQDSPVGMNRDACNAARFRGDSPGHYESWFQRANHPTRPLGFWIRYTIFSPADGSQATIGELWAIVFDGEKGEIHTRKSEHPIGQCSFSEAGLKATIADATLTPDALTGAIEDVRWDLRYESPSPPLLMLPEKLYAAALPKAKTLVGSPLAKFSGSVHVGDTRFDIDDWIGSQNHNWGSKHTDRYAWGQVAGFDDQPDAFLECATAKLKLGPIWSPAFTTLTLRLADETLKVPGLIRAARNRGEYDYFRWSFEAKTDGGRVIGTFEAPRKDFVALRYYNPPGGSKTCLNTKIARCRVEVHRPGQPALVLETKSRAAFEILTDDDAHGLPIRV